MTEPAFTEDEVKRIAILSLTQNLFPRATPAEILDLARRVQAFVEGYKESLSDRYEYYTWNGPYSTLDMTYRLNKVTRRVEYKEGPEWLQSQYSAVDLATLHGFTRRDTE